MGGRKGGVYLDISFPHSGMLFLNSFLKRKNHLSSYRDYPKTFAFRLSTFDFFSPPLEGLGEVKQKEEPIKSSPF